MVGKKLSKLQELEAHHGPLTTGWMQEYGDPGPPRTTWLVELLMVTEKHKLAGEVVEVLATRHGAPVMAPPVMEHTVGELMVPPPPLKEYEIFRPDESTA